MPPLSLAGVVKQSVVDGPGLRLTVFTQGCPHKCPGCHNPDTHDFEGGQKVPVDTLLEELDANPLLAGVTLSGGEPLCRARELLPLAKGTRARGKNVVCFTGYTFEELLTLREQDDGLAQLLPMIDLLIDGRYEQGQRDLTLNLRGSRNQRVLDLPVSLASGRAVWAEGYRD